jgi:flagellin
MAAENELGSIGAFHSRSATTVGNLPQSSDNDIEEERQIMDADVALNAAELVKDDLREHAASALLAQSNQLPALLLRLLTEQ